MTNVNIEIHTTCLYTGLDEAEEISYRTSGTCRRTRDGLKVEYKEPETTGMGGTVTTLSVLPEGVVSVNRVGTLTEPAGRQVNMHLVFEPGKMHACIYDTGFFPLQLCVRTHLLENSLSPEGGCFDVDYSMEIGGQRTSRNRLKLVATPANPLAVQETEPKKEPIDENQNAE